MKIQADRANDVGPSSQIHGGASGRGTAAAQAAEPVPATDRIDVSSEARLVNDAVRAAEDTPEIRQDVVERAKAKLAAGEIGSDPERLAERMIDSLLGY